jgi:hypothetical protein
VLLDAVEAVHWETCDDEDAALIREADLIVMLRPSFNASHAEQDPRCYIIVTDASSALCRTAAGPGRAYGTFPHLAPGAYSRPAKRTKAGYAALLRLLAAGSADAALPAPVHDFLSGRSVRCSACCRTTSPRAVDEYERRALARDDTAAEFYELGRPAFAASGSATGFLLEPCPPK